MSDSSIPLTNSRRRFEKRTYTPLILQPPNDSAPTNALGLAAQVRALTISDSEYTQLQKMVRGGQLKAVNAMQNLATAVSASGVLQAASTLASASGRPARSCASTRRDAIQGSGHIG